MNITIPRTLAEQVIAHAREAAPREACGVVGLRDGRVVRVARAPNYSATPQVHFTFTNPAPGARLAPGDGYRLIIDYDREGLDLGVYHSHPASPAYPSSTDRREMSQTWPGILQLMVSLRHGPLQPELNAYRIDEQGEVTEVALRVEG
jgi:proteasome lid subunit RPN8/RPN11